MSGEGKFLEYFTVYAEYKEFNRYSGQRDWVLNFEKNMEEFENLVNDYFEEGWQTLGAHTFSIEWLSRIRGGLVIQALVREKNVEPAVVVDVNPAVVVAEQVRGLRSSARISASNSNSR